MSETFLPASFIHLSYSWAAVDVNSWNAIIVNGQSLRSQTQVYVWYNPQEKTYMYCI